MPARRDTEQQRVAFMAIIDRGGSVFQSCCGERGLASSSPQRSTLR